MARALGVIALALAACWTAPAPAPATPADSPESTRATRRIAASTAVVAIPSAPGVVTGTITDRVTGRPAAGLVVLLQAQHENVHQLTRTDANGTYVFTDVAPGSYDVTVRPARMVGPGRVIIVLGGVAAYGRWVPLRASTVVVDEGAQVTLDLVLTFPPVTSPP